MKFDLERIERLVKDVEKVIYTDKELIDHYEVSEVLHEVCGKDITEATSWDTYETGELWGGYDKHQWFKTTFRMPKRFEGKNVIFKITTGHEGEWDALNPQFLLYLNGEMLQGLDVNHREVVISECAKADQEYSIALLGYSGLNKSRTILETELCVLDTLIEEFYYNLEAPVSIAKLLNVDDENRIHILAKLNQTVDFLDLRKAYSENFYKSITLANEYLKKEFYSVVNYDSPVVTAVGNTHIDIAWLWTIGQTKEKTIRSYSTVIALMEKYPDYKFVGSQPQLYQYVKEYAPELYGKIKSKIIEQKWEADGAMWLEADCNIPSGESLVRQILVGHKFFKDEFGIESKTMWLPDVFGYSAALPQILKKSGIEYFMTTKLDWNQFNVIPNDTFLWKGIDGSEILAHFVTTSDYKKPNGSDTTFNDRENKTTYTGIINANQVMGTWKRYKNKDISEETLMLYGYGDGGGGPTKEMLERAKRLRYGLPGCPRLEMGFEGEFFDRLYTRVKDNVNLPRWEGELYLEYHRGTLTSMAKNKRYNRKSEFLYLDLEAFSTLNMLMGGIYPEKEIKQGWSTILLNQFHDILPGTCIKPVYDESHIQYEEIMELGRRTIADIQGEIASRINLEKKSVVVFNSLSFEREDIVEVDIPEALKIEGLIDETGNGVDIQLTEDGKKLIFFAKGIPSKGYKTFSLGGAVKNIKQEMEFKDRKFENQYFKIGFDKNYNIETLYDKRNKREVIKQDMKANVLTAYEDRPMQWENWDIDIFYQKKYWTIDNLLNCQIIECGPVRYCIKFERTFCDSTIIQYMYLYRDIPRIDFKTCVDWREKNVLLKVAFPVDINSTKATYEIQYGNVERETHNNTSWDVAKFEVCGHKWADLSEGGYGVSLLNDSKYGYSIKAGIMSQTLIKAGTYPNPEADLGYHEFTYSIYPHGGSWREANTPVMAYNLNVPLYSRIEEAHGGENSTKLSLLEINKENCIVEVVKKAEVGNGVIVRMYEYKNARDTISVKVSKEIESVFECDLMENITRRVEQAQNDFSFEIKPFEIKTFLINFK